MLPALVLGAAIVVKGTMAVWFASRATSPLSADWRKEFLDGAEQELNIIETLPQPFDAAKIADLRQDIELLRYSAEAGWLEPYEYRAAIRISSYRGRMHTLSGLSGVGTLMRNSTSQAAEQASTAMQKAADKAVNWFLNASAPHQEAHAEHRNHEHHPF